MKIKIKAGKQNHIVDFQISTGIGKTHMSAIASSSKELDLLQTAISDRNVDDDIIGAIIAKAISNKLKLPVEFDYDYNGAGYGLKLDIYSIIKKLK